MSDARIHATSWLLLQRWNFRNTPPEEELLRYLKAVLCCANGDGRLSPSERGWVLGYGACLGLSEASMQILREYPATEPLSADALQGAGGRISPKAMLYDAIAACMADHDYHDDEAKAIRKAAVALRISLDVVATLEALAHEERTLRARRIEVAFSDEPDAER
jgi:uncharacterized membrane protein YebE (DUF533 family)